MLKTGKLPATPDGRDLLFHSYVDTSVIDFNGSPPSHQPGHSRKMPTPRLMLGNGPDDSVEPGFGGAGCCVFSCFVNFKRLGWAISGKGLFPATGLTAIENYSEVTGYVLGDDSTDQGTDMRAAMNWLRKTGLKDSHGKRHTIGAWAKVDFTNFNHVLWALYLSNGGVPLGVRFPDSAMRQFDANKPWTPVAGAQIDGGHAVLLDQKFRVETWARDEPTVEPFLAEYLDEAYFVVDDEGLVNGKSIEGFDGQQLLSDARALSH